MKEPTLLQHHLRNTAATFPERTAVLADGLPLTYAELDRLSGKVAAALAGAGVGPGDRVAISMGRAPGSLVGVYGILKTGAAYVPLEYGALPSRQGLMAEHSEAKALVTRSRTLTDLVPVLSSESAIATVALVDLGAGDQAPSGAPAAIPPGVLKWKEILRGEGGGFAEDPVSESDPAVIHYTSGTTGVPKGALKSHRSSMAYVRLSGDRIGIVGSDVVSGNFALHFGASLTDIFSTCRAGATLVHVPERYVAFPVEVAKLVERTRMSVWYSVTSSLVSLAVQGNLPAHDISSLRAVVFGGEAFPIKHLRGLMSRLEGAKFMNWYGATEFYIGTWYEITSVPEDPLAPIPIGKPFDGIDVFAMADDGSVVEGPGKSGVLYVKGPNLMSRYWRAEAETAAKLVPDPRPGESGVACLTGDVVSMDEEGNFIYVGRNDDMVKARGFRIEPTAIESVILGLPGARDAAVVPVPDERVGNRLFAFVVPVEGSSIEAGDVLDHCRKHLPGHMVPETVVIQGSLPHTSTGKVDRRALINRAKGGT